MDSDRQSSQFNSLPVSPLDIDFAQANSSYIAGTLDQELQESYELLASFQNTDPLFKVCSVPMESE